MKHLICIDLEYEGENTCRLYGLISAETNQAAIEAVNFMVGESSVLTGIRILNVYDDEVMEDGVFMNEHIAKAAV